jgi:hypothetical protein
MLRKKALNYTMRNNTLQVIPSLETRIRVLLHHMGPTHPEKHQSSENGPEKSSPLCTQQAPLQNRWESRKYHQDSQTAGMGYSPCKKVIPY